MRFRFLTTPHPRRIMQMHEGRIATCEYEKGEILMKRIESDTC